MLDDDGTLINVDFVKTFSSPECNFNGTGVTEGAHTESKVGDDTTEGTATEVMSEDESTEGGFTEGVVAICGTAVAKPVIDE